jgi:hypothetical protein
VWRGLIASELAAAPETKQEALDVAEHTAAALWSALDGVERQRQMRRELSTLTA